jgi:glycosyltransferase involved in cell wall biosynthesis
VKVWLLNPYGQLPGEGWRDYRFTMIMRALADRGHDVTWWTAGFDHHTKTMRATTWDTRPVSDHAAIRLVPTPGYRKNVSLRRLWFETVFAWRVLRDAKKTERPDVIVAADPPQPNGVAAVLLARHFRVPLVLDCLDLWPEAFAGALSPVSRPIARPFFAILERLRSWTYSRASAAIASCETYRRHLLTHVRSLEPDNVSTVFLGIATGELAATGAEKPHDTLRVIYAGSLGQNYDIGTVLDCARLMLPDKRVTFAIAGDGPFRDMVIDRIRNENLTNTSYAGRLQLEDLRAFYASADLGLIPYASWSTVAMPVKLYDYLAAGLPFITSLVGELGDLALRCDAGISYKSGDAASLAAAIVSLAGDASRRRTMAENARRCAGQFERDEQYRKFSEIVERVARSGAADDRR